MAARAVPDARYFIAFVDRVNAGFAALQMNQDIGLTQAAFGLGGGLFYIAYVICEVPSNLAMEKVGARLWIARIMITWGSSRRAWRCRRAVLVLCCPLPARRGGGGFFPGVILYLTYWFPGRVPRPHRRIFMVAIPVSSFLGSPISAALLQTDGMLGLHGWQWMFILEAVPAVLLGIATCSCCPTGRRKRRG